MTLWKYECKVCTVRQNLHTCNKKSSNNLMQTLLSLLAKNNATEKEKQYRTAAAITTITIVAK